MRNIALKFFTISFVLLIILLVTGYDQSNVTDEHGINNSKINTITFLGKIKKSETYERQISEELYFRLMPFSDYGWIIWIGNIISDNNYIVTPPYRGMNSRIIQGWHFRNEDNTDANDGSVNAPQEIRVFQFVFNEEDYAVAEDYINKVMWSYNHSEDEINKSIENFKSLPLGSGKLTITEMEFDNYTSGERAGFEYIEFEVELHLGQK